MKTDLKTTNTFAPRLFFVNSLKLDFPTKTICKFENYDHFGPQIFPQKLFEKLKTTNTFAPRLFFVKSLKLDFPTKALCVCAIWLSHLSVVWLRYEIGCV